MALVDNIPEDKFREICATASSMADICRQVGYAGKTSSNYQMIRKRMAELNIKEEFNGGSHRFQGRIARNPENTFILNSTADQKTLRKYYMAGKYTPYKCSICGQEPIWQNQPMNLILDHINGHNKDDRLENLRWVCPNCNSQLPTTGIRNVNYQKEIS